MKNLETEVSSRQFPVASSFTLETGDGSPNWLLATGYWKLVTGNWQLVTGYWKLVTGN
jgi:hypothetical protein